MILLIVLPVLLIIFAFVALIEYYNAKLEELAEFINNPPPHDCCMCGSDVNSHGWGDSHSPISIYDYYSLDIVKGITIKRTPSVPSVFNHLATLKS